jgi:hypothetical protein
VQRDAFQVLGVAVVVPDFFQDVGLDAPQTDLMAVGGDDLGKRRAHVAGAKDG